MQCFVTFAILSAVVQAAPFIGPRSVADARMNKRDYWGPSFSSGPTDGSTKIIYAAMTLTPGAAPSNPQGDLFIWPGVGGTGDLLQMVFMAGECGVPTGSWCVQPYVAGPRYINGPTGVAGPSDQIRIQYGMQADGTTWIQNATNLATGQVLTTLISNSGNTFEGVGTADECNNNCSPTVSTSTYTNWEVHLDSADPGFVNTFVDNGGATHSGVTSEQGGKIWKIATITIPPMS